MARRKKRKRNPASGPSGLGARMEQQLDGLLDMMDKVQRKAEALSEHCPPGYQWLVHRLHEIQETVDELGTNLEMQLEEDAYGS